MGEGFAQFTTEAGDGGGVLAVQGLAQLGLKAWVGVAAAGRNQRRQAEVTGQLGDAKFDQRAGGHGNDFGVGGGPSGTDQLGTDLSELAFGPQLRTPDPEHLSGIAESERTRRLGQPGLGDAGDLGGNIGAHGHHPLRFGVHEPEGLFGQAGADAGQKPVFEFDQGRFDPVIAVAGKTPQQPVQHQRLEIGVGGQNIGKSSRQ